MQICGMLYMRGHTPRQMRAAITLQHMNSKPNCWVHEPLPEEELPLKWSQAAPCMGKRVATFHIHTASSDTELKLIWSGFRQSLIISRAYMCASGVRGTSMRANVATRACTPFRTEANMCTCGGCDCVLSRAESGMRAAFGERDHMAQEALRECEGYALQTNKSSG